MKQLINYVLTGTLILAAMACQREPLTPNGGLEGSDVKEVTTQFVLNIASAPTTKMTADVVQLNDNFRGISDATLFCYKVASIPDVKPHVLLTDVTADKKFEFASLIGDDALDSTHNQDGSTGDNKPGSKRVLNLSIPIGTNAILFYAIATKASGAAAKDYGYTTMSVAEKAKNTKFSAMKILDGTIDGKPTGIKTVDSYDATAKLMIYVINYLLHTALTEDSSSYSAEGWTLPAVSWAQYGHQYEWDNFGTAGTSRYDLSTETEASHPLGLGHKAQGLEEVLGKCYYLFTYIRPASEPGGVRPNGEYRAGSSFAVKSMIIDMYKVISAASGSTPTDIDEANAKRMATSVLGGALKFFDVNNGTYQDIAAIKTQLTEFDDASWTANFGGAKNLNQYPFEDYGIPEGAAQLGFVVKGKVRPDSHPQKGTVAENDEFFYHHPNKPLVNPTMTEFEPRKYVYPAELMYYVNSPIRTNSNDVTVASYPDGVTNWNTSSWTGWTYPGTVDGGTRGVAVAHSINYGVALLKSSVVIKDGVTAFVDNRYELTNHAESSKTINVSDAGFKLRGILVGGVNPRMNWQFTRFYESYSSGDNHEGLGDLSKFDGVIYDHSLASTSVPTATGKYNYTLVYDNYNSSETPANQNDVYISLEFENGPTAFYGRDNMIPAGGVFYLVAKLEKPAVNAVSSWPADHHIPPLYGVDGVDDYTAVGEKPGESKKIARVFIQDFMTTATFKLNANSLKNAYYSTPDLRASQMSLGLSVDLVWTPGLNYEKEL